MSALTIESGLVHYEVLGRGRPVIFVHGWLGSWRFWVPTMQQLSVKYRTYALDLWGFGDSSKDTMRYGLEHQVNLLFQFFERLGIPKAALIGHSLGAATCLRFARLYPDRVYRLLLISPPLTDLGDTGDEPVPATPAASNTAAPGSAPPTPGPLPDLNSASPQFSTTSETVPRNPFRNRAETPEDLLARLKARPLSQMAEAAESVPAPKPSAPILPTSIARPILPTAPAVPPPTRPDAARPLLAALTGTKPAALLQKHAARDLPDIETLRAEVEKMDDAALIQSAASFTEVNLGRDLKLVAAPTLLLHGEQDTLLPPPADSLLRWINTGKPNGHFVPLVEPALGHFPMLEIAAKFNRLLSDFLEATDLTSLQFKDQWRRTLR
ncbi:MAG: alpha/beta hydrolase [Anaerolineae bacterium]|nr:alpha/beta hydrolase [Anaerolineae bacterium]